MIKQLEKQLDELTTIVEALEKGETTLHDALGMFEKGVKLTQSCQKILLQAEQKIQTIGDTASIIEEDNTDA